MRATLIILALLFPFSAYAGLNNGLVGYWPLDKRDSNTSTLVTDRAGSNTGTLNNAPTFVVGRTGQALNFVSASSQNVNAGNNSSLNPTAITVSAWIKGTSFPNAYNTIVQRGNGTTYYEIFVKSTGKLAVYLIASAAVNYDGTGTYTLSANKWYHVVFTYSSTAGLVSYVNGLVDKTVGASGTMGSVTSNFFIANDGFTAGRNFNGIIDDVRVYNRALSAGEVKDIYRQGIDNSFGSWYTSLLSAFSI